MFPTQQFLSLALLLAALPRQAPQPQQTQPGPECQGIQKHVKKEYDRFRGMTTARLDEMTLIDRPLSSERLTLRVEATYESDKGGRPKNVTLIFNSQAPRLRLYQGQEAIFLADGERLRSVSAVEGMPEQYGTLTRYERKDVVVRYEDFVKIANAQTVEMQLGAVETKFDKKVLKALHEFVSCEVARLSSPARSLSC
jgi:hypothetical protein